MSINYYKNKIKLAEAIENKKNNPQLTYQLEEKPNSFYSGETMYIEKFLFYLRKHQDLMYKLLITSKTLASRATISSFIVNFVYANIFGAESIDEELLFILYRTLKFEVSKITKTNESSSFLSDSINAYLLSNLIRNDDVKVYFSKILSSIIDKIDGQDENKLLTFDPIAINEIIQKLKLKNKNGKDQLGLNDSDLKRIFKPRETISGDTFMTATDSESSQIISDLNEGLTGMSKEVFFSTFIPDLTKADLVNSMNSQKNPKMADYICKQINDLKNKTESWYSNAEFINNVYKSNDSTEVLDMFHNNFSNLVDLINELFNNLILNIEIIPNSIRYISKMIAILIRERFPTILQVELNSFISRFFFDKIFKPIFTMADYSGLLKSTILLTNTKENINLIQKVLQVLVSGSFFNSIDDPNFTILNRFFIEIMPKVLEFFDRLIDVPLPNLFRAITTNSYGEEVIGNIPLSIYVYDYLKENPKEHMRDVSMCYTVNDLLTIHETIGLNEKLFFSESPLITNSREYNDFKGAFKKLQAPDHMKNLINAKKKDEKNKERTFVLVRDQERTQDLADMFNFINQHFQLKEIKHPKTDEEKDKNLVIKMKNALCKILFNFKEIPENNFFGFQIETTEDFQNCLTKLAKINYYNLDTSVESDWYILSLKSLIKQIPEKYKDNDCSLLYQELSGQIEKVLKSLNISLTGKLIDKLRLADNNLKQTEKNVKNFEQIELNNKIQDFLDTSKIEVSMNFSSQKGSSKFIIKSSKDLTNNKFRYLDDFLFEKKKEQGITCQNIFQFTKMFPNFSKIEQTHMGELFNYEEKFEVPKAIKSYLLMVRSCISEHKDFFEGLDKKKEVPVPAEKSKPKVDKVTKQKAEEERKEGIVKNIYDIVSSYIINRIYDKIYPHEPDTNDSLIHQQCVRLSWVEPHHLCKTEGLNLDNILPRTVGLIKELDGEKNPEGKLKLITKVIHIILNNMTYCVGKVEGGVDDQVPMLIYIIIKAQPERLSSNIIYLDLFGRDGGFGSDVQKIDILKGIKQWLLSVNHTSLLNVSEEVYEE